MLKYVQAANEHEWVQRDVGEIVAKGKSDYQEYLFFRSPRHGLCVVLDGDIQSVESDEAIYHEALVHPAMLLHPSPRRVLIMGGGEGATAREVLKHPTVETVVMVDIDRVFVDLCREHLASWGAGAFEDPRLELIHDDINAYLERASDSFDVVIGDLVDVHDEASPAAMLYSETLYRRLRTRLGVGAVVATQGGPLVMGGLAGHNRIREALGGPFPHVRSYGTVVPSFFHLWGFVLASAEPLPPLDASADGVAALIAARASERDLHLPGTGGQSLANAFTLPNLLAKDLA